MNLLITGATGNTGYETIRGLREISTGHKIIAGAYRTENAKSSLSEFEIDEFRKLDFADPSTFDHALDEIDIVFLLRPPQLADVSKYFEPFLNAMLVKNIRNIVFLSVQGVENQKNIPHHKLEKLILVKGMDYVFLRPSYFMQNLTTTLIHEIKTERKIFIPSGNLKFTWVDTRDIGRVSAHVLNEFGKYQNQAIEITGKEQKNFHEVAQLLSEKTGHKIDYESPNLLKFFIKKMKQGVKPAMILVMIMLHYLPRFSKKKSQTSSSVKDITGKEPVTLEEFMEREKKSFQ